LLTKGGASVLGFPAVNGIVNQNATPGALQISTGQTNPPSQPLTLRLLSMWIRERRSEERSARRWRCSIRWGASHILTYTFTKTAANSWSYRSRYRQRMWGEPENPVSVKAGTLTFNGAGQLTAPAANVAELP